MNQRARIDRLLAVTVVCGVLTACGSNASSTGAGNESRAPAKSDGAASALDACALIDPAEITKLLGVPVAGKPTSTDSKAPPGCMWENPANLESVSLEIGNPGTASGDTLPAPEAGFPDPTTPGPDGMRFLGPGSVEFAAGGRSNTVQVAVLSMLSGEQANDAAVGLARKVGPQLPN